MAAVFTMVFLAVGAGLSMALVGYASHRRRGGKLLNRYLPLVGLYGIAMAYLVAKVVYEELIPCIFVDAKYCDFDSTQYRNLFGWEF
jgi:hypothetical protein